VSVAASAATPVGGPRLLHALTPRNLLSFGPDTPQLTLGGLNVLVGPNGSGKSNLLDTLALLRSTPGDLRSVISQGGGAAEWVWKGAPQSAAALDVDVVTPLDAHVLRHLFAFRAEQQGFRVDDEVIEPERRYSERGPDRANFFYHLRGRFGVIMSSTTGLRELNRSALDSERSILAQRRDPDVFPELAFLADQYERVRIYREWSFGRRTIFRRPQPADLRSDRLEEDFSNLGLILSRMRRQPRTKAALIERLRDLYDGLTDVDVSVEGGTVQVFFTEGDYVIPATRLSDGSLRYLCLLVILLDPDPPPLIGLEEPELGLHPDLLPKIADLLVDASTRTQLIVTTHSDVIIDALSERPESVVVFEKHEGRTTYQRLDRAELAGWLTQYRLGQLWTRGQIGGTRW